MTTYTVFFSYTRGYDQFEWIEKAEIIADSQFAAIKKIVEKYRLRGYPGKMYNFIVESENDKRVYKSIFKIN